MRGLRHLAETGEKAKPLTIAYGTHREQVGDLRLPGGGGPHPVVVLIHGGFWHVPWDHTLMNALAADLSARGIATWNIEYARIGLRRGEWPGLIDDVAAAIDHLALMGSRHGLDLGRVATCGHSAGGQLAIWAASRRGPVHPVAAVSLAGVLDLAMAGQNSVGGDAVAAFLGGAPEAVPDRCAAASPIQLLPLGVAQLIVHGEADEVVPAWLSVAYQAAAVELGDDCALTIVAGEDHMRCIDPRSRSWAEAATWLEQRLGR
jgi:acetyl esterase/lipase